MLLDLDLISISRIVQAILSLIALGLNASVIHYFNTHQFIGSPPGYLILLTFTSVFTLLISIPYTTFTPTYFPNYINRYASLTIELITTIFWFSGFVAGAVWLGKVNRCVGLICQNARAGVVFAALLFLCFCITSYFPIKYCFFDDDNNALGERNWTLGLSGAERITRARMQRDAANNARVKAEQHGEETGMTAKVMRNMNEVSEIVKVRCGNVMQEWRTKAGRNREAPGSGAGGGGTEADDRSRTVSIV